VHRGSREAVKKQTDRLRRRLYHLELIGGNLARLKQLNNNLVVVDHRGHVELDLMDTTVGDLMNHTRESLRQLEQLDQQWNDAEKKLDQIGKSLNRSEVEVKHSMQDDKLTATQRLSFAKVSHFNVLSSVKTLQLNDISL